MRPPFEYDEEIANHICERFATEPVSLKTIVTEGKASNDKFPGVTTVFKWLEANPEFAKNYARSKEAQGEMLAEETLEIADDAKSDWINRKHFAGDDESPQLNGEAVARARLRIDTRKWLAAHLRPKKWGDKIEVDQTVNASDPLMALLTQAATGKRLGDVSDD